MVKSGHNILTQMFEGRREMEEVTFVAVSCNPQPCKPLNRSWFFSVIVAPCCFSCRVVLYGNKQDSGNIREYRVPSSNLIAKLTDHFYMKYVTKSAEIFADRLSQNKNLYLIDANSPVSCSVHWKFDMFTSRSNTLSNLRRNNFIT